MTREIAERSVDLLFQHDDNNLWIGFFGGEPLLELDLIKYVVRYSRDDCAKPKKTDSIRNDDEWNADRPGHLRMAQSTEISIKLSFDGIRPEHETERGQGTGSKLNRSAGYGPHEV